MTVSTIMYELDAVRQRSLLTCITFTCSNVIIYAHDGGDKLLYYLFISYLQLGLDDRKTLRT